MQKISSSLWSYIEQIARGLKFGITMKMAVAVILFWVIYRDLSGYLSLSSWQNTGLYALTVRWPWLAFIVILTIANWTLEAFKWQVLFKGAKPFGDAIREVLVGVTSGLITPGRVGEYFGRYYVSKHGSLTANVSGTFFSSVSQNFVNVVIGLLALYSFRDYLGWWPGVSWPTLVVVLLMLTVSLSFCLAKRSAIKDWIKKVGILKVSGFVFSQVLLLSLLRYLIYTTQFTLMFWALGSDISFLEVFTLVAIVYLIQSGLPLPPFLAALARVEIALLIFSYHIDNELLIVCSTLLIWIINVISPALLGWIYLLNTNRQ